MKISKTELEGKKVTTIPSELDKFIAAYKEQMTLQSQYVMVATDQVIEAISGQPKVNKLWVNRDKEGMIASVDVEHV